MSQPWMKFYPRDWRGDQALRVVSLAARGLWMEMLCIMHESNPYGHLLIGGQPVSDETLARVAGTSVNEVQALLVELQSAGVLRKTRSGVVYSKRMTLDYQRSEKGRKDKLAALREASEKKEKKPPPSRVPARVASTQKPEARGKIEGVLITPSILTCETPSGRSPIDGLPTDVSPIVVKEPVEQRRALADQAVAKLAASRLSTFDSIQKRKA